MHNLNFIDISKYHTNKIFFGNIKFSSVEEQKLFRRFTSHPLLLWDVKLIQDTVIISFDLITNITTSENYLGGITLGNTNFVHSPCLICEYGDFSNVYSKRSEHEPYSATRDLVEEYRTRTLFSVLNSKIFDGRIFYHQNSQG